MKDPESVDCAAYGALKDNFYEKNRLVFEWLKHDDRRAELFKRMNEGALFGADLVAPGILKVPSRAMTRSGRYLDPYRDDPDWGHSWIYLVTRRDAVVEILQDTGTHFSNRPYADLGSGSFMLALDPARAGMRPLHDEQVRVARQAFPVQQKVIQDLCVHGRAFAAVQSLATPTFDLAAFSEQAALRFSSALFGFALSDHLLLEQTMRGAYEALTYEILGRHFVTDPCAIATGNTGFALLLKRTAELIGQYEHHQFPQGVYALSDVNGFDPVMRKLAHETSTLSGTDRALLVVGLMAGIIGNIQASVCIAIRYLFSTEMISHASGLARETHGTLELDALISEALQADPPAAFLPRYCVKSNYGIPADHNVVLALGGATSKDKVPAGYPMDRMVFGLDGPPDKRGIHWCIGSYLAEPMILEVVRHVLRLPALAESLDTLTGEPLGLHKTWGFRCERYPLDYRRDVLRAQQTLNVVMRIKAPVKESAAKLRQVINVGAPRIEEALRKARHVHFAWFEFIEDDTKLVLHTVYDGDFSSYIQFFALQVGDLFDLLFQYIEDAPPMPVRKYPNEFVALIQRYNVAPLVGYMFSAYPLTEAAKIARSERDASR